MQLWCPTTKVQLVLPCLQEEYDKLLKYAVVVSDYYCHVHRTQEYDELLKYAVVVSDYYCHVSGLRSMMNC